MQLALLQAGVAEALQTGAEQFWLWVTAGGFVLATVWFVYLAVTRGRPGQMHHYVASTVIVLWAGLWYIVMATGSGIAAVRGPGGFVVYYYARYIDWTLTTPLLLLGLIWIAGNGRLGNIARPALGIVVADVLMILTGVVAGGTRGFLSGLFFVISTIFFLVVLALLWGPVRTEALSGQTEGRPGLFFTLASILTVLWILYPIVWLLGTEGTGVVSPSVEVFFYAVLDVLAKIAFGATLLGGIWQATETGGQQARPSRVS